MHSKEAISKDIHGYKIQDRWFEKMILFRPYHVQPILDDLKVKTRRLGKRRWNVESVHKAKTAMIKKDYFALLRILTLHREPLGAMTEKDAWEEGGYTLSGYRKEWENINGHGSWDPELVVWVVQFERVFNLEEICKHCWARDGCMSNTCCVKDFLDGGRYATPKEIVEFCCRKSCHHTEEYHDSTCPLMLAGAAREYLSPVPRSEIDEQAVKDDHGFIIKRLTDWS